MGNLFTALAGFLYGAALVGVSAVYVTAAGVIALTPGMVALLGPPVLAMAGAVRLTSDTVDAVAGFLGFGNKYPKCCCQEVSSNSTNASSSNRKACAVWAPMKGRE